MEKSDTAIVVEKSANKEPSAELMERRAFPKGKSQDPTTHLAQNGDRVSQGIERLREFVERNPKYTTLLHHINEDSLKEAYHALKRDVSPGVDQVTWEAYGADLDRNLADLCTRVHRVHEPGTRAIKRCGSMHARTPWIVSSDPKQAGEYSEA